MALSHLGIGKEIASMDERSQEASALRRFYATARDATLSDFPWPFAKKFKALELVTDNTDVEIDTSGYPEWRYYYRYPSDCLVLHRILSGLRNDSRQSRVPYLIVQDASGSLIYTDQQDARIEYTVKTPNPTQYAADFILAFSYRLASLIAPRITGGDNFKIGQTAYQLYKEAIADAKMSGINEEQADLEVESEFIRLRGGADFENSWNRWRP